MNAAALHVVAETLPESGELTRALRTAAALVRERDWRGLVFHYEDNDFAPLRWLVEAVSSAIYSFPLDEIGPSQICALAPPGTRETVAAWLAIFGCAP